MTHSFPTRRLPIERAAGVDPDDRAAAGPDLGEVDRRDLQRIARAGEQARAHHDAAADLVFQAARHLAGLDQRGFCRGAAHVERSEEHTSELQSLMRISYAVFCLTKKNTQTH